MFIKNLNLLNTLNPGVYQTNPQQKIKSQNPQLKMLSHDCISFKGINNSSDNIYHKRVQSLINAFIFKEPISPQKITNIFNTAPNAEIRQSMIDYEDETKKTVLMWANNAEQSQALLNEIRVCGNHTIKKHLLHQDIDQKSALMYANAEQMKVLLKAVPDYGTCIQMLTQQDKDGNTALMYANAEQMKVLLDEASTYGPDTVIMLLNHKNKDGKTALMLVENQKEIDTLLEAAPDYTTRLNMILERDNQGKTASQNIPNKNLQQYLNSKMPGIINTCIDNELKNMV